MGFVPIDPVKVHTKFEVRFTRFEIIGVPKNFWQSLAMPSLPIKRIR